MISPTKRVCMFWQQCWDLQHRNLFGARTKIPSPTSLLSTLQGSTYPSLNLGVGSTHTHQSRFLFIISFSVSSSLFSKLLSVLGKLFSSPHFFCIPLKNTFILPERATCHARRSSELWPKHTHVEGQLCQVAYETCVTWARIRAAADQWEAGRRQQSTWNVRSSEKAWMQRPFTGKSDGWRQSGILNVSSQIQEHFSPPHWPPAP